MKPRIVRFRLSDVELERLDSLAAATGYTRSEVLRRLLALAQVVSVPGVGLASQAASQ